MPSGPMLTHGSDARSKFNPPGAQRLNGSVDSIHFLPPSKDATATSPCAPPLDQRSCWNPPTKCCELVGSAATCGSTSALTELVPVPAPTVQVAYGLGPETSVSGATTAVPAVPDSA